MPSPAALIARSSRRSLSAAAYSCVTSRKTITTPIVCPAAFRIGAALSAIWRSVPSRAMRAVWLAKPTMPPVSSTFATGSTTGCRVWALMIRKTSSSGRPVAPAKVQPVNASATGFIRAIFPAASVAMTASPIDFGVMSRLPSNKVAQDIPLGMGVVWHSRRAGFRSFEDACLRSVWLVSSPTPPTAGKRRAEARARAPASALPQFLSTSKRHRAPLPRYRMLSV